IWLAGRFVQAPTARSLAGVLAMSYLQILSSIYLGWFLMLGLAIFGAILIVIDRGIAKRIWTFLRQRWLITMGMIGVWAALLVALFAVYAEANRGFHRSYSEVLDQIPRPT